MIDGLSKDSPILRARNYGDDEENDNDCHDNEGKDDGGLVLILLMIMAMMISNYVYV